MWQRGEIPSGPAIAVAHRGGVAPGGGDPVAAVATLAELGVKMVEFDVRRTADGVLVVHHDATLERMELSAHTYAELTADGPTLATLAAFLDAVDDRLALDVEVKETGYEAAVMEAVLARTPAERVIVTSFHDDAVLAVRRAAPEVATGLLIGGKRAWLGPRRLLHDLFPFGRLERCKADFLAPNRRWVAAGGLRRARRRGIGLLVWTVNDADRYRDLERQPGVLGIVTDSSKVLGRR